jgi:hypothetical protein
MGRRTTIRARASDSALVDPAAREKLQAAAEAAGLTIAQLADLVRDSGALALPPEAPDGITFTLTLGDLGQRMWGELQKIAVPERTAWFEKLLHPQQIALVTVLAEKGFRPEVIGRELGINPMRVREIKDTYADRVGAQVTQLRLSTIAGHVQLAAERAMSGLQKQEKWKEFWTIQKDMVGVLQSLGIVEQAIHRVEITHKTEDGNAMKAEIDAMIELEKKKLARIEEIQRAQQVSLDSVPQLQSLDEK